MMKATWCAALALMALCLTLIADPNSAAADACDDCKQDCQKELEKCQDAGGPLCELGRFGDVCDLFENFQCPLARNFCVNVGCGVGGPCGGDPPPKPSGGGGFCCDPHFRTFDGSKYDLQAVGEFVVARSKSSDVEIQARFRAYNDSVSVASVAAIRASKKIIVFSGDAQPTVDGASVDVPAEGMLLASDVFLARPKKDLYIVSVGAHTAWVSPHASYITLYFDPSPASAGDWVGLLGDLNGDTVNDFVTKAGKTIELESMTREVLYGEFGNSWRISDDESILPYGSGENTATFTDLSHPKRHFSIAELDAATFEKARKTCVEAGITAGEQLRNCIYDVGLSGDASFAMPSYRRTFLGSFLLAHLGKEMAVRAPARVEQGADIPVFWSQSAFGVGSVRLLTGAGKVLKSHSTTAGTPLRFRAPGKLGVIRIELAIGSETATQDIEVIAAPATLDVPAKVAGASEFKLSWSGPRNARDYIAFSKLDEPRANKYMRFLWSRNGTGTFQAPAVAGTYEVRYVVTAADGPTILARKQVVVGKASASLEVPSEVGAGVPISVTWSGPAGSRDYIDLVLRRNFCS